VHFSASIDHAASLTEFAAASTRWRRSMARGAFALPHRGAKRL